MTTALINAYRQMEDYFFRGISDYLNLGSIAKAYRTGIPVADLNLIYVTKATNSMDKILSQGKEFFDDLSFIIVIPEEFCTPEVENVLNTMGYLQVSKLVSMGVKLDEFLNSSFSFDDNISIKANDDKLNEWMIPLIGAFESTIDICSMYAAIHEKALKNHMNMRHFSLYERGSPIASLTLSIMDTFARIDDVGTLPKFQNKGYATRLMIYALSEAKRLGATYCFLDESTSFIM